AIERALEFQPVRVYGSSGSIHALAQVAQWQETGESIEHINGHVLETAVLQRLTRQLSRMDLEEREALRGIDTQRASIIVPGAMVLEHVLQQSGLDGIVLSDFGVREGLVTDYIASHAEEITAADRIEDVRLRSVVALANKFKSNLPHSEHVARL